MKPRATLGGVALLTKGEVVEVNATQVAADETADIKPGDQLLGYLDPNQARRIANLEVDGRSEFTLWERAAGSRITIPPPR
ncbi:MAG: hypothetical protein R3C56_16880 [Pirellulaceae bacterium]